MSYDILGTGLSLTGKQKCITKEGAKPVGGGAVVSLLAVFQVPAGGREFGGAVDVEFAFRLSFRPRANARKPDPSSGRIYVQGRPPPILSMIPGGPASGDGKKIGESRFLRKTKAARSSRLAFWVARA